MGASLCMPSAADFEAQMITAREQTSRNAKYIFKAEIDCDNVKWKNDIRRALMSSLASMAKGLTGLYGKPILEEAYMENHYVPPPPTLLGPALQAKNVKTGVRPGIEGLDIIVLWNFQKKTIRRFSCSQIICQV